MRGTTPIFPLAKAREHPRSIISVFAILLPILLPGLALAQNIAIQMDRGSFRVAGWTTNSVAPAGGWSSVFTLYAGAEGVPPILGSYAVENGALFFRPQFPLSRGVRVRAIFHPPNIRPIEAIFQITGPVPKPSTRLVRVYPSTDLLPANQLKFYLSFSAPMQRGQAWHHIHLLQSTGAEVHLPFLEINQELWNRDNTRLTVLFDPGRIKRGVLPNLQMGMALQPGKRYTLVVDRDWIDATGAPMVEPFRKFFRVGPAARAPVDPDQWHLTEPKTGTLVALVLDFPEPLDQALLHHLITVTGPAGPLAGHISITRRETQWSFVPKTPWQAGDYQVVIGTALEDLAGNKVGEPFDVDTFKPVTKHIHTSSVSRSFRLR